jgi:hypothetical protein
MEQAIRFFVKGIWRNPDGKTVVVGVPDNRLTLSVGTTFVEKFEVPEDEIQKPSFEDRQRVNVESIRLTVRQIESYRKLVDALPPGVTGGLFLEGEGISCLKEFCFLTT